MLTLILLTTTILLLALWRNEARRHGDTKADYRLNAALLEEAHRLKSQVMHLDVENSDPSGLGRVGWKVSAFIPSDVLSALERQPERLPVFTENVAKTLVRTALKGIFERNHAGHCTAVMFDCIGGATSVMGFFEGDPKRQGFVADSTPHAIKRISNTIELEALANNRIRQLK